MGDIQKPRPWMGLLHEVSRLGYDPVAQVFVLKIFHPDKIRSKTPSKGVLGIHST